jgi:hypothetical protein
MCTVGRTVVAWATAAMMLLVHTPRLHCRCPDGHTKPFCPSLFFPHSGCCCSNGCCGSERYGQSGPCAAPTTGSAAEGCPCCCHDQRPAEKEPQGPAATCNSTGCAKVVVKPPTVTPTHSTALVHADQSLAALLPQTVLLAPAPRLHGQLAWLVHLLAPPTDLVILLQHFLI